MVQSRVAQMEGQPHKLKELAQCLVQGNGPLRILIIPLVVFLGCAWCSPQWSVRAAQDKETVAIDTALGAPFWTQTHGFDQTESSAIYS